MVYERCKSAGALLFRIYNMTQPPAHGKLYFSVSLITYWPQEPQFLYYFLTTNFHNFLHWYWTFIIFFGLEKMGFFLKIYDRVFRFFFWILTLSIKTEEKCRHTFRCIRLITYNLLYMYMYYTATSINKKQNHPED